MHTNKLGYRQINFHRLYKIFIAFVVTPSQNYGIFCHFGGYDKGFYCSIQIFNYAF